MFNPWWNVDEAARLKSVGLAIGGDTASPSCHEEDLVEANFVGVRGKGLTGPDGDCGKVSQVRDDAFPDQSCEDYRCGI